MGIDELREIMVALRERCPWDKKQTRRTLLPYLVEESYELLEALEADDTPAIREELGDLLFQIVFHSRIAEERGEFTLDDVIGDISQKMRHRHPHVFGDARYDTAEEVLGQWETRKKEEGKGRTSILEGVPSSMPALLRAHRLQSRAARAGFDWPHIDGALGKLEEELGEFREALKKPEDAEAVEDELGDIFFALVNVARFVDVNPEHALRKTISRFIGRFRHIEEHAESEGRSLDDMTLEEMDALWDEAKLKER